MGPLLQSEVIRAINAEDSPCSDPKAAKPPPPPATLPAVKAPATLPAVALPAAAAAAAIVPAAERSMWSAAALAAAQVRS